MSRVATYKLQKDEDGEVVGYEVTVFDPATDETIEEYSTGNSVWESQAWFPYGHRSAHDSETMRGYARQTCKEMAEEHGAVDGGEEEE